MWDCLLSQTLIENELPPAPAGPNTIRRFRSRPTLLLWLSWRLLLLRFFFFNDTATTEIYTLSLHDALPIFAGALFLAFRRVALLFRDLVLVLGFRLGDLALVRGARIVLGPELGLGDVFFAFRVGCAGFLLIALHRIALGLFGFVVGFDAVFLGLARFAVDARLGVRRAVGTLAEARLVGHGGLGRGDAGRRYAKDEGDCGCDA